MTNPLLEKPPRASIQNGRTNRHGLTPVGWAPEGEIGMEKWTDQGRRFGLMARCSQWWVGDWVRYGDEAYGTRYNKASKISGYDVQTLMNMVYVALRFEISRRRESLSWSHHAELAPMNPEEQCRWLDWCEKNQASVNDLRVELRRARHMSQLGGDKESPSHEGKEPSVTTENSDPKKCPQCGYEYMYD